MYYTELISADIDSAVRVYRLDRTMLWAVIDNERRAYNINERHGVFFGIDYSNTGFVVKKNNKKTRCRFSFFRRIIRHYNTRIKLFVGTSFWRPYDNGPCRTHRFMGYAQHSMGYVTWRWTADSIIFKRSLTRRWEPHK